MGRLLNLVLMAFMALGNSFSHSHEFCHDVENGERAHIHIRYASGEHSLDHGQNAESQSHHHDDHHHHQHTTVDQNWGEAEVCELVVKPASCDADSNAQIVCGCDTHCSECDHLIWFPELNRILASADVMPETVLLRTYIVREFSILSLRPLCVLSRADQLRPRYTEPIYLEHSALLL